MTDNWLPVVGWEGLYEVSDFGRVRSIVRKGLRGRQIGRVYGGKLLKSILKKQLGYVCVTLHAPDRPKVQVGIHRLVLEAFVCAAPPDHQACHNNGIRHDNRLSNLRWGTVAENQADKVLHGTSLRGEKNHKAKLTADQVKYIKSCAENQPALAKLFGVSQVLISRIRLGKAWSHIA